MSIPLVQEATKDAINTSIIAIKRNIERINMLLGLVDSGSPDLSGLATKQELEDAITQVETDLAPVDEVTSGNMQSVTSNAVAKCFKFEVNVEVDTGMTWNGNKIYRKVIDESFQPNTNYQWTVSTEVAIGNYQAVDLGMSYVYGGYGTRQPWFTTNYGMNDFFMEAGVVHFNTKHTNGRVRLVCYYCKTNN